MQRGERVVDQAIDLDALAQQPLAALEGALAGDADFGHARSGRNILYALDQRSDLAFKIGERNQEIGFEHDKKIAVIPVGIDAPSRRARPTPER